MRLYFSLDQNYLQVQGPTGYASAIDGITTTRGDTLTLGIGAFLVGNSITEDLGAGVTPDVRMVVKETTGDTRFEDAPVLQALSFPKVTIGGLIYYQAVIPVVGTQIDSDLLVAGIDKDEAVYSGTISLLYNGGRQTSAPFTFTVRNNFDRNSTLPAPAASSSMRAGSVALVSGQDYTDVNFTTNAAAGTVATAMPDATWRLVNHAVVNTVDGTPLNVLPGIITARTANGYRVQLTGAPDSANYSLVYSCAQS